MTTTAGVTARRKRKTETMTKPSSVGRRPTQSERLTMLEEDSRAHAKSLTVIVEQLQGGFNAIQLAQIKTAFREETADIGLRTDGDEHQDEAREDFRWVRRTRKAWDGAAKKIGNAVLWGVIGVGGIIVSTGFWAWISSGGKPPA